VSAAAAVVALVQLVVVTALAPLLVGLMRQVRARSEGRVGAGLMQPWRDLRKLLAKDPVRAEGASWILVAAPVVLLASSLIVAALLPLVAAVPLPLVPNDLFVVVSLLLLGTVAVALLGLDSGTAFGGMGSSRHMTVAALVEPTVLVAVYALSVPVGSSTLALIVRARLQAPSLIAAPVSLIAVIALAIVVIAETGRLPVDNPATHLELTMIHEAMVLESSARDLAWLELGSWIRLASLLGLMGNLLAPWGVSTGAAPLSLVVGVVTLTVKLAVLGAGLSLGEVFMAKLRLFRVPELLAGSFVLAFLAVTASYLLA